MMVRHYDCVYTEVTETPIGPITITRSETNLRQRRVLAVRIGHEDLERRPQVSARQMWSCCRYIVKIDMILTPQSRTQVEMWDKIEAEDRRHFTPLLAWGPGFVVEAHESITKGGRLEPKEARLLRHLAGKYGIEDLSSDTNPFYENMPLWRQIARRAGTGQVVIHDYGYNARDLTEDSYSYWPPIVLLSNGQEWRSRNYFENDLDIISPGVYRLKRSPAPYIEEVVHA